MSQIFNSLAAPVVYEFEEKRSRFLAYLYPIQHKNEGEALLSELRQRYPDARHYCTAYVIGNPEQTQAAGFNDDGEPGGTAGKPMLNVLLQRKVGNVYAVVVRYFGGIKLGAGGLVRAYGAAVSGALDQAELLTVYPLSTFKITVPYAMEERVRNCAAQSDAAIADVYYDTQTTLTLECRADDNRALRAAISELCSGQAIFTDLDL